ncbi:hypothetical protein BDV93DRAFT_558005 [Ceratobasidium sp. AG-I]|nr:hypothetical protein BDV93DRAFT_558005 [Ceratobasidium sp. AG-I]
MHHSLKRAVTGALGAVAPILLKQWLKVTLPHEERDVSEHRELSAEFFVNWPLAEDYNNVDRVHPILPQIVMHLAVFAVSHSGCYGIDALPKEAILALRRRFLAAPILFAKAFKSNANHEINRLICSVDFNSKRLGHDVLKLLIDMFSLKPKNRTLFQFPGISAASVAPFLRILDQASCEVSELQTLLDALAHFSPTDGYSLQGLEISEDIFGELLKIGEREEYRWVVAKCILRIIETAASRPSSQKIEARAVVGTFDAVAFALGALPFDQGRAKLLASTCELLTSSTRPTHTITTCPAVTNLRHSLQSISMKKEQHEHERTKLEEITVKSLARKQYMGQPGRN